MSDWLKTLLGVEDSEIPAGAVTSFEFANLPRGTLGLVLLLAALALIAGVFWIYRREGSASPRVKTTLAVLRALVLACGFLLILEPILAVDQIEEIEKSTIVLLDSSLSMTSKDRYRDPGKHAELNGFTDGDPREMLRYQIVNEAISSVGLMDQLARQNSVVVYEFTHNLSAGVTIPRIEPVEAGDAPAAPGATWAPLDLSTKEARARGTRGTNLAGAVRLAVEEVGSDKIAAIILVSDGRNNLGPPPADLALFLRNKDLVLHTVVVGESETPRNLRVVDLAGPDRVFRKDPAVFEARVSSRGYSGTTVEFERRIGGDDGQWEPLKTENVDFDVNDADKPVLIKFTDRPETVGTVEYRVRIEPEPDESNPKDNEKYFTTQVVEEKAKVLLVSGGPAHEYYAIKNVLLRDSTVTLACFLQSADAAFPQDGNVSIKELPQNEKELFEYDVVMLHDPSADGMPPDWPALLKKFVSDHRGGLCFIAGNKHTLSLVRDTTDEENKLTGILPVVLDLDQADTPGVGIGFGRYFNSPWQMVPEPAGLSHPITRFHSDPQRAKELVWERLPSLYWSFPVLRAKPGAVVLARHGDPRETVEPYGRRPVVAVHRYGGGRVMFLAADETHRWRSIAEDIFDRFWVQSVRFLLEGRHAGAKRRFRIYLDRELVDIGDAVRISAEVFDESFEPLERESVVVTVGGPAETEEEVMLLPVEGKKGQYGGSYAPALEGDYELRPSDQEFRPKDGVEAPGATFRAEPPHREMSDVRADRALLKDLAARTKGTSPELHQLERLADPKLIPPASEQVVTQGRPIPLWDTWTTIIVVLTLLCLEWILRKRYRMV